MKRIFALVLALAVALSFSSFAGDTFNPNVDISEDGLTVTVQGSSIFQLAPTLTVKCTLTEAYVTHNGQVVESTLDTVNKTITFVVADVNGGAYVITAGQAPTPTPDTPDTPDEPQQPQRPVTPVGPEKEEPSEEVDPQPAELPFTDLSEADWFYGDVAWVYEKGLMNGLSTTAFGPGAATSRGMIVTILWRLEGQPAPAGACPFADVTAGSYYEQAIAWAAENGIVTGVSATAFQPNANITREQFAAILYRYAKNYKGYDVSVGEDTNILSYSDALSISDYAFPALQWACGAGLMNGSGDALMPGGFATRAQAAALLHRFCQTY